MLYRPVGLRELASAQKLRRWCVEQWPQLSTVVAKRFEEARARMGNKPEKREPM